MPQATDPSLALRAQRHAPWKFWTALVLQLVIILAVPSTKYAAYATGTTVLLRTHPVDPMDILRGRFVRLGYDLDTADALKKVPGWIEAMNVSPTPIYVTLAPEKGGKAWKPVHADVTLPAGVAPGHVVIQGQPTGSNAVNIDLGEFVVPEDQGDAIEKELKAANGKAIAEVRVDRWGHAVLVGLHIGSKKD